MTFLLLALLWQQPAQTSPATPPAAEQKEIADLSARLKKLEKTSTVKEVIKYVPGIISLLISISLWCHQCEQIGEVVSHKRTPICMKHGIFLGVKKEELSSMQGTRSTHHL